MSLIKTLVGWQRPVTMASTCLLALSLAACGGSDEGSSSGSTSGTVGSSSSSSSSGTAGSSSSSSSTSGTVGSSSSSSTSGTVGSSSSSSSSSGAPGSSSGSASIPPDSTEPGRYRVNAQGRITDNGTVFPVRCGNWFGLEGQHEPKDAESNPNGAPLELYIGNMWWVESGRTIQQTMTEIKQLGINTIRLPVAPQTLEPNNEQGMTRVWNGSEKNPNGRLKNTADAYPYANARAALEGFLDQANTNGLKVIIDIHSCSNYLGWRAGRLDAQPPYADATRVGYDFKREEYSCSETGNPSSVTTVQPYNEAKWLENLKDLAGLANKYPNIMGIDVFNEPWDYTWDEWATLAEKAYEAIDSVNKNVLVLVEGIGSSKNDGTEVEHGDEFLNPNWGENFYGFTERPLQIPRNRVVISPHTYGPAVYVQQHFMDGECSELHGDEAGEAKCQINIHGNVDLIRAGWDEHFGFLRDQNYAMVIGEFGGNMDWPNKTRAAENEMWKHITEPVDVYWQEEFVDYMKEKGIEACYWSINPESADTYGLYEHKYDPVTADDAWGQWGDFDPRRVTLLKNLWGI